MTARPDLAARNRARALPWPPSCVKCGRARRKRPEGGYGGGRGKCDACYMRDRRAAA